jgi:hypothetical protein
MSEQLLVAEPGAQSPSKPRAEAVRAPRRGRGSPTNDEQRAPDPIADEARRFVASHPDGWNHEAWLGFLDNLREAGVDTSDPDAIGCQLERERLGQSLRGVNGLGQARIDALVSRHGSCWNVAQQSVEELEQSGLSRQQAERVRRRFNA